MRDLESARAVLTVNWSDDLTRRVLVRARRRIRRRRGATAGLAVAALLVAAGLAGRLSAGRRMLARQPAPPPAVRGDGMPVIEGFSIAPGAPGAAVRLERRSAISPPEPGAAPPAPSGSAVDAVEIEAVEIAAGAARFRATTAAPRRLRIRAGRAVVTVQSWAFVAARAESGLELRVERGTALVWVGTATGGEAIAMREGEHRLFLAARTPAPGPTTPSPVAPPPAPRPSGPRESAEAAPSVGQLLAAADAARAALEPTRAVELLERVAGGHPRDPRAGLAAFTSGRILLEELDRPRAAADAFARAAALAGDPLAEDALAREVEAWTRAGEADLARARARVYLERYPGSYRAGEVRSRAGLP
jgi:hypothetical protein